MELNQEINIDTIYDHSKRVQKIYKLCILLIIVGVCVLLAQLWIRSPKGTIMDVISSDSSDMISPQYKGKTDEGQDFLITSNTAKELEDGLILLDSPIANLFKNDKLSNFILDSASGLYDDKDKILTLTDNVELDDEDGNTLKASEIKLDLEKNIISSDNKIDLTGKMGKITADGLEIKENGNVIIFKGKSKMIVNEADKKANE